MKKLISAVFILLIITVFTAIPKESSTRVCVEVDLIIDGKPVTGTGTAVGDAAKITHGKVVNVNGDKVTVENENGNRLIAENPSNIDVNIGDDVIITGLIKINTNLNVITPHLDESLPVLCCTCGIGCIIISWQFPPTVRT